MNRRQLIDRLAPHYDLGFHQQIQTAAAVQLNVFVDHGQRLLGLDLKAALCQFEGETRFVRGLQQSWP